MSDLCQCPVCRTMREINLLESNGADVLFLRNAVSDLVNQASHKESDWFSCCRYIESLMDKGLSVDPHIKSFLQRQGWIK